MGGKCTLEKQTIDRLFAGFAIEAQKQLTSTIYQPKKRVIVLAGPTGCGKSAFAIPLAKALDGEIISADSMQIYRGMDIGTAKPTLEQRAAIPHQLIDTHPVKVGFNVVDFFFEARHFCHLILARNRVPIVVGGSGFYLRSLIYGPPNGPPSVPELRQALEEEISVAGPEILYERLKQLDPQYAATITKNDRQKIVRALEIITLSGKKVSQLSWKGRKTPQNYDFRCWFLYRPRDKLYESINRRCEKMIEDGLIEEVERLKEEGLLENHSASQAIGYRQTLAYLETARTAEDFAHFVDEFKQASRRYAKRQWTWFRHERDFRPLDLTDPIAAMETILDDFQTT